MFYIVDSHWKTLPKQTKILPWPQGMQHLYTLSLPIDNENIGQATLGSALACLRLRLDWILYVLQYNFHPIYYAWGLCGVNFS